MSIKRKCDNNQMTHDDYSNNYITNHMTYTTVGLGNYDQYIAKLIACDDHLCKLNDT